MKSDSKKLFTKLFLFPLPLLLIWASMIFIFKVFPMNLFDGEYAEYQQQKDYIESNSDQNKVIILGDSRAKAGFYPPLLSDKTYNLALGGTSAIENYYYFKEYLEQNDAPEYVFFSLTSAYLRGGNYLWDRSVFFHRISVKDMCDLFETVKSYDKAKSLTGDRNYFEFELFQYKTFFITKYLDTAIKALLDGGRLAVNKEVYANLEKNRGQKLFGTSKFSDEVYTPDTLSIPFVPSDIQDTYLRKLIELCIDNNIKFIMENVPMNDVTYKLGHEEFLQSFSDYMKRLQKDYPQIIVNPEILHYDKYCFGDSSHMNWNGVQKYSNYIRDKYKYIFKEN